MRSSADRLEDSKHVLYEIEMLCQLAVYFESGEVDRAVAHLDRNGIVVRNALIEAFQVHARQLIDFLTTSLRKADPRDLYAWQFTTTPWIADRKEHKADWKRFSQRVMHLTIRRATFTAAEQLVETRRIRDNLASDLADFLEVVDPALVSDDFVARVRAALRSSEPPPALPLTAFVPGATEPVTVATSALPGPGTAVAL